MPLSDYLAKNYLSADTKPSKKRKRKHAEPTGLTIADDSPTYLQQSSAQNGDDDDESPVIVPDAFRHSISNRKTTWKTYGTTAPSNAEQAAADAILASAEAERKTLAQADDDAPAIVNTEDIDADYGLDTGGPEMASGAKAGLQTAAQVAAQLRKREQEEKTKMAAADLEAGGKAQETIYRDASGRIINVAMKRAELRRKAEEEERRKVEDEESRRGDVQRREKEARKRQLEDASLLGVARYADDTELNREMKDKERWNDPAMGFLTEKTGAGKKKAGSGLKGKKTYQGASEPNRYGIKPGYRWDGVDRSNAFERKWFEARNARQSRKEAEYAWEMDE